MFGILRLVLAVSVLTVASCERFNLHSVGLRLGRRQATSPPAITRALTYGDLGFLVSVEAGKAQLTEQPTWEQAWTLLNLASDVLHKPKIIVIAFLPTKDQTAPKNIYDSSLSPFAVDGSHDCPNASLECIRKSLLEFSSDEDSDVVVLDSGVEFLQWMSHPPADENNVPLTQKVANVMKETMEPNAHLLSLPGIDRLLTSNDIPLTSIDDQSNFFIGDVEFSWDVACSKILMAEALALEQIRDAVPDLAQSGKETQVLVLSPARAFQCFGETEGATEKLDAAESLLFQLTKSILDSVDRVTDGQLLGVLGFHGAAETDSKASISTGAPIEFAVKEESVESNTSPTMPVVKQIVQRRALQATETVDTDKTPRKNIFWISIALVFALVLGVLRLLSLTNINDPILSTKLFTSPVH